ncbi:MAG: acyltransferase [Lachnospiraceae bacterium]|nr:acyltransferase [Lachnospiraceae bacterium]
MKSKSSEVNILRGIAFCLVLLGHSFPDAGFGYINSYTEFSREYIYSFHMPLFFIISGFCMESLLSSRQTDIKKEVVKRSKRLLIPYLFYSYIVIIPKLMFNSYMHNEIKKTVVWEILLGKSSSTTLWYLWNLFMINVFFLLISRITSKKWIWLLAGLILYIGHLLFSNFYFDKLLKYSIFYVFGIYAAEYFPAIKKQIRERDAMMFLFMIINAMIIIRIGSDAGTEMLTALLGSISMLCLAIRIDERNGKAKSFLELSSQYSYGIYLMSPYVQVAVRVFLYQKLGMPYLLCMGFMLVLGFLIPYIIIKHIVEKNVYLSRILIGQW